METTYYNPIPAFVRTLAAVAFACVALIIPIDLQNAAALKIEHPTERTPTLTEKPPPGFADISTLQNVEIEKRYATTNNFCGEILDTSAICALRTIAYQKFEKATQLLHEAHPGWSFVVFDAYRPTYVQEKLWRAVRGTPLTRYVAYPKSVSLHSLGLALDLTLADSLGHQLDMGTDFDAFTPLASPRFEAENLRTKKLTAKQYANRLTLRRIMQRAGFIQLQSEWWHYEALHEKTAHERYHLTRP